MATDKQRLDVYMHEIGMTRSRKRATEAIRRGEISVNGRVIQKPAYLVDEADKVTGHIFEAYVSRAGEKLEAALEHFSVRVEQKRCLDVGASTGGFTDCLLQRKAQAIVAIDVGRGQINPAIAADERVTNYEGMNARHLRPGQLGAPFEIIVMDVSFISLTLVLPAVLEQASAGAELIALIKPQFELNSEALNAKGIVKSERLRSRAIDRLEAWFEERDDWQWRGVMESPITGGDGNQEYLLYATKN